METEQKNELCPSFEIETVEDDDVENEYFVADMFRDLAVKSDIASMEHPVFTLSSKDDRKQIIYQHHDAKIHIKAGMDGLPTIFDKDVLIYCTSFLMQQVNKGIKPPKTLRFSVRDLLLTTQRTVNGQSYDLLEKSLARLHGVSIETNVKTNNTRIVDTFHLIERYRFVRHSNIKDRMVRLQITVSDWLYNSILGKEVLTIPKEYFGIRKPLERRIYEIARKHCGHHTQWEVSLQTLYKKTGTTGTEAKFRFNMHKMLFENALPGYIIARKEKDLFVFRNRSVLAKKITPATVDEVLSKVRLDTENKAREMVRKSNKGWDFYAIVSQFSDHMRKNGIPDTIDGAFIGFVKLKLKKTPS